MAILRVYDSHNGSSCRRPELLREYYLATVGEAVRLADEQWEKCHKLTYVVLNDKEDPVYSR